jgi:hypothetical protein
MKKKVKTTLVIEYYIDDDQSISKEKREAGLATWAEQNAHLMMTPDGRRERDFKVKVISAELVSCYVELPDTHLDCKYIACDDNGEWWWYDKRPVWRDDNYQADRTGDCWRCMLTFTINCEPGKSSLHKRIGPTTWEKVDTDRMKLPVRR